MTMPSSSTASSSMLVSLASNEASSSFSASIVGGKAASLAKLYAIPDLSSHVPHNSFCLTVDFFQPWIKELLQQQQEVKGGDDDDDDTAARSRHLQAKCQTLPLNKNQQAALDQLQQEVSTIFAAKSSSRLLAVRSSAPEEDGSQLSFAGAFETKLGVTSDGLEQAIRDCFASRFDARVLSYISNNISNNDDVISSSSLQHASFAVIVMEMVDSQMAGVAFSANPVNSDRDELVIDSSFGLGESVVDGSVNADRYLYDKVSHTILQTTIGKKTQEKRLLSSNGGGVETKPIASKSRQTQSSLTDQQVQELAELVCVIEQEYGMPMDVEWAYTHGDDDDSSGGEPDAMTLKLLQARPITTLFSIDDIMMTLPSEKRVLYFDYNVVSDATTTSPFTHMDVNFYSWASSAMMGLPDRDIVTQDPSMPIFNASTRQYANLSLFFKYMTAEKCAKGAELLDPYLASIFASKDCDRDMYKMEKLPKGVGLGSAWKLVRQFPLWKLYKTGTAAKKDPEKASREYQDVVQQDLAKFKQLEQRGPNREEGLQAYARELFQAMSPSFELELGINFFVVLPLLKELDQQRREGKTKEIRTEYDALCSGYEGDFLMQINMDIYKLANSLPETIWQEYSHDDLPRLVIRIQESLEDEQSKDLPRNFLDEWKSFMDRHGWDGQNQLFPSSPRYIDSPVLLLAKLKANVGAGVKNPADIQKEHVENRRKVVAIQEERARNGGCLARRGLSKIQKRDQALEHLMLIRNAPKLHLCQLCGILRAAVLKVEEQFLQAKRLEREGDIFHVDIDEVDRALRDELFDLMSLVRPRKIVYERALREKECPILIDSRCRILRPDPPEQGDHEEGTLIGAAVSPGVATGRVRVLHDPAEEFHSGEILAAVVTGPPWTPLFAGALAVVLQVGGVLQHGALCAREYGKPAVSNIDVNAVLKTGMMVTVDGNTGTVKILDQEQ